MTHTERWWSKIWMGTAAVKLANDKRLSVSVHKHGTTYWVNRVLVNPDNSRSIEDVIRYVGVIHGSPVKEWEWEHLRGCW